MFLVLALFVFQGETNNICLKTTIDQIDSYPQHLKRDYLDSSLVRSRVIESFLDLGYEILGTNASELVNKLEQTREISDEFSKQLTGKKSSRYKKVISAKLVEEKFQELNKQIDEISEWSLMEIDKISKKQGKSKHLLHELKELLYVIEKCDPELLSQLTEYYRQENQTEMISYINRTKEDFIQQSSDTISATKSSIETFSDLRKLIDLSLNEFKSFVSPLTLTGNIQYQQNYNYFIAVLQNLITKGEYLPIDSEKLKKRRIKSEMEIRLKVFKKSLTRLKNQLNEIASGYEYEIKGLELSGGDWDEDLNAAYQSFEDSYSKLMDNLVKWSEEYFESRINNVVILPKNLENCYRFNDLDNKMEDTPLTIEEGARIRRTKQTFMRGNDTYILIIVVESDERYVVEKTYAMKTFFESNNKKR